MTAPRLAICIPTYNRAPLLRELLDAIRAQSADVEIVVSDNASTDGTADMMAELAARDPRIVSVRQPVNRGPDANYLEVVRHARAEFCWLMGSDDHPAPGGVAEVLAALGDDVDVLLTDRRRMSRDMGTLLAVDRFLDAEPGATFDCARPGELERFLRSAHFIGSLFSYLSAIVVRRSLWDRQPPRDEFIGSAYVHVARIFDMLRDGGRLSYLASPVVLCRSDNDSFQATLGALGRLLLDFNYVPIARAVFRDRPEACELVVRLIERNHFRAVLDWRLFAERIGGKDAVARVREASRVFEGRPGYRRTMALFDLPAPVLGGLLLVGRGARRGVRTVIRPFGGASAPRRTA
jgi:abequosyltransferase